MGSGQIAIRGLAALTLAVSLAACGDDAPEAISTSTTAVDTTASPSTVAGTSTTGSSTTGPELTTTLGTPTTSGSVTTTAPVTTTSGAVTTTAPTTTAPTTTTTTTVGTTTSTVSTGPQTFGIAVSSNQFSPANRTITVGDTIVWSFTQGTHTTTSNGGLWDSGPKSSGSFSHQFDSAGSFGYRCTLHSSMTGTITVNP